MPCLFRPFAVVLFLAGCAAPLRAQDYVWLEGEKPAAINIKRNVADWGNKHFLSDGKWLVVSIDEGKVDKEVPEAGVVMQYKFKLAKAGRHEVWNRLGYEFVRSPFLWRIDDGEWQRIEPDLLTTDLMEISFFTEVAWLKMGDRELKAGDHTLDIKLPRTKNAQGKTNRILYACDALCLHAGKFHPHSRFKPDETGRDARDEKATKTIFKLVDPEGPGARSSVALQGLWEVTRHDEQLPGETARPIPDFPKEPHWKAIEVPGDKNALRPDLIFAHRLWYRTRVQVPARLGGSRSFHLVFPQNNLNTTVYVNGVYCGFNKNPYARFAIDVTKGIKPGVNEVQVGIKDAWYGYSTNPKDPLKLRKKFNLPLKFSHEGFQDLAYPIWNNFQSGILATPELVAAGPVYAADVFCKPSVVFKELALEVTLRNSSGKKASGEVLCQAVDASTGKVANELPAQPFALAAGAEKTLAIAGKWTDPRLWWPDRPNLYRLRAVVKMDGKTRDISETTFGFREWTTTGKDFRLNGIPWHGWADTHSHATKEKWVDFYRQTNQRFMRFWGTKWMGLSPDAALDFFDKNGVVVRRSGILDGEAIGYMAIENDPDLKKESPLKMDLMRNWREQMVAQVKGERNHPSVMIWSIENEWLYINCINLYGGLMDQFEAEVTKTSEAVQAADPTRPTMTDGGGACKANTMPVQGDHYTTGDFWLYPELAYTPNLTGGGRGRWVWDQKRPRFIGEELFAQGHNPAFAYFGGEEVFVGQASARRGVGICVRMLTEGYRWAGIGAVHFWQMQDVAVGQYAANAPQAVFCRQWDWTFGSGQKVKRTIGIFNDEHEKYDLIFNWKLTVGGKEVTSAVNNYQIGPGTNKIFDIELLMPRVTSRQEGELTLELAQSGKFVSPTVFKDVKAISVLPTAPGVTKPAGLAKLSAKTLLVYDPQGTVPAFLKKRDIPFTSLADLKSLPKTGKVLIVGKDALDAPQSTSSALAAYASSGRTVIVLEQKNPLKYQAVPADMDAAVNEGRTAFGEDLTHPALQGLEQKDFFTWGPGEVVYRNAYQKPTRGARSLVQCHDKLQYSGLVEVPIGKGLLLLNQLLVGEKLAGNAVAQKLLLNLIGYAGEYQLEFRQVAAVVKDDRQLARTLDALGLRFKRVDDPLEAIGNPAIKIAVISASPANLKVLAENLDKVRAFTKAGGWILFNNLTPQGFKNYNVLVDFEHMIRPFRRERVTFPPVRNRLTSGLTTGDIVMYSSEQIFPWQAGNFVVSDEFSYVVDIDDVAPFAKFPNDFLMNMVNGFVSADAWKYIVNVPAPDQPPLDWLLRLPREQEIVELEWIGNTFYYPVTRVELIVAGQKKASFATRPNNEVQTFAVNPPLKGKDITIRLADWDKVAGKAQVTGVDNIRLKGRRPPEFYKKVKPLLNIGAMVEYPHGRGGLILCNLLFKDTEQVPENALKKRTILATLLRNLKAPFSGGKTIIAGSSLKYQPIDISTKANQYRTDKGWFGDKSFTFKDLPTGKHTFAGVLYDVYDFATSPVPTCIMLGGQGIPNKLPDEVHDIPVGRKADALFFLHAARLDARRNPQEIEKKMQFEMCRYVVIYADGKKVNIPINGEIDIEDYRQKTPAAIPGAQVAWTRRYEGTDLAAVAYSKQWNNPRSDVAIKSIDMVYGAHKRGVPVLLALTAASANP